MTSTRPWPKPDRRSAHVYGLLLLVTTVVACLLPPAPAQADTAYSIEIMVGTTSNGSLSGGDPNVFTPTGPAILGVDDLEAALSKGPVIVGDPASTGTISIDAAVVSSGGTLTLRSSGGVNIATDVALEDLTISTAGGAITQSAGALTVLDSSFDTGSGTITLAQASNDFFGMVSLAGGTTHISDQNALPLGEVSTRGSLTATAGGALRLTGSIGGDLTVTTSNAAISQVGPVEVIGTSSLDAGTGTITLSNSGNFFFGAVSLTGGTTQITDLNSLTIDTSAVSGDLLVESSESLDIAAGATVHTDGAATFVSDAEDASPPGIGDTAGINIGADAQLTAGKPLSLYAPRQDQVSVGSGATLNGATYAPGAPYVDTAREVWGTYYPDGAAQAPYTFFFKDRGLQTITFDSTPPGSPMAGESYTPAASSTSGLPVTLTVDASSGGVCSMSSAGTVAFLAAGTCVVDANQSGNSDYQPAPQVQQSITVAPRPVSTGPGFPGPVTGETSATSSSPTGSATAKQGCATATALGLGTVTVATYGSNPVGQPDFRAAGTWFDVQTDAASAFSELALSCTLTPNDAGGNTLYWWDGTTWRLVSGQTFDPQAATIAATLSATSSPSLTDLAGTVFAVGTRPVVSHLAGADRQRTAIEVSRATYGAGEAGAVVLARQDNYPDALVGGPLAVAHHAPLLLTASTALSGPVSAEVQRVLPAGGTVFLLGGRASLAPAVADSLVNLGYRVHRLGGVTRYDTAVAVARQLPRAQQVFLATGDDFPDALAASSAAAHVAGVVLLTRNDSMPDQTRSWLARHPRLPVTAVGGPAADADPDAARLVGKDRYDTARVTARRIFGYPSTVGLASGRTFPDALTAVTELGPRDAPLLLTQPDRLPAVTGDWLTARKSGLTSITIFGGTGAVHSGVEASVTDLTDGIDP